MLRDLKNLVVLANKRIEENCSKINQLEKDSSEHGKKLDSLIHSVYSLEEKVLNISDREESNTSLNNITVNEIMNRMSRLNNVIIYNLIKSNGRNDKCIVDGILKKLNINLKSVSCERLNGIKIIGKISQLLVKFSKRVDAITFMKSKELHPPTTNLSVDKTKAQRIKYKQLRFLMVINNA